MQIDRGGIKTLLFDLDGTLADTAPDMANALNKLLQRHGKLPLPYEAIRNYVSRGGAALVQLGFGNDLEPSQFEKLRLEFLDIYAQNLCVETRVFPGLRTALDHIDSNGMNWGVVTNKPGWLTDPLMKALGIYSNAACVISGDTLEQRKPHPGPVLHACEQAGSKAHECLFIGDDQRDIEAGNAAGTATAVALYGYIDDSEQPADWGATVMLESVSNLVAWLLSTDEATL